MIYFDLFASGFLLSLSLCLDIGIVNIALINTAIRSGMRSAMLLGLGSCFGDLFYALLSLLGIGLLLQFEAVHWFISLAGIAILLFLAWDAARSALRDQTDTLTPEASLPSLTPRHLFVRGVVLSLASPTSILWFAAIGGSMIAHSNPQSNAGLLALFGGFFCGGFSWCLFITGLSAQGERRLGDRFRRYCNAISALLFVYFAVRIGWGLAG
jgi:L-lysine exporter family protein LysE/ArgO